MAAALGLVMFSSTVTAGVIGSLDATRTYLLYQLDGGKYDDIRNAIIGDGHTVVAGTGTVTPGYLAGLDVFYTGMLDTSATGAEISALQNFASAGGVVVIGAENVSVNTVAGYNSWFNPFGLSVSGGSASGGSWAAGTDPLLASGVAGSALGFSSGTDFTPGAYNVLATDSTGDAAVVSLAFGSGLIIGLGDGNFINDPASAQSQQFFRNIMALSPASTPEPGSFTLLFLGLGGLTLLRRRIS